MENLNSYDGQKLVIITDAWQPHTNGVVRTIQTTIDQLTLPPYNFDVKLIHPKMFSHFGWPVFNERKQFDIPYKCRKQIYNMLEEYNPDYIHIGVEGTLGGFGKLWCLKNDLRFTTAYHTKFPEYVEDHFHIPASFVYPIMKKFHNSSSTIMSATKSIDKLLMDKGFTAPIKRWTRGVDYSTFNPSYKIKQVQGYALYAGRVSVEKNIEAFLEADTKNLQKVVVGDGPEREKLQAKYSDVHFVGIKKGKELAQYYANADVFVFPSLTDTFGLVQIEALACGTPIAAFPVDGPKDIVVPSVGALNNNLSLAIEEALTKNRQDCADYVRSTFTWEIATKQFVTNLVPVK